MHLFEVWAPKARTVDLVREGATASMKLDQRGWWLVEVRDIEPGADYAYSVDGGTALPDPRSAWQPNGVHGPSRLIDHGAFRWNDVHWQAKPLPAAVFYELHVGTFTPEGTFDAAIGKLDYLTRLGVTHLELMPVAEFPGSWGWGYDGVDLFAPHHGYGGPEGLKRLVDAAHRKGLAVVLDVVYNHLGPAGNYLSQFGPYFTGRHATPWGPAVNLDGPHSYEVRRFFCDNALMWLRDYHMDGLRIDAVHALIDNSAMHLLEQLATEIEQLSASLGRHLILIAESDLNDPRIVSPRAVGGYGIDAQWSDDFHHALHSVLTGEASGYYADFGRIEDLAHALERVFVYDGRYSAFRQRPHGRPARHLPAHRFLGYIQNHDQVGNRALGERLSHLVSIRCAKIAAGLVLTAPFVPMLFQGEEWAASTPFQYFTCHEDEELGRAVSEGRRSEFVHFGWERSHVPDPQDEATFQSSKLNWDELTGTVHSEMLAWYRELIRLRHTNRWLVSADLYAKNVRFDEDRRWLTVERGPLTILCNFSGEPQCVPAQGRKVLISSDAELELRKTCVQLPPECFAVIG